MDIRGIGAGGASPELAGIAAGAPVAKSFEIAAANAAESVADSVAGALAGLSEAQLATLMEMVQATPAPQRAAQADQLMAAAAGAVAEGEVGEAVARLTAALTLDPRRAEALLSEPALAPIRREMAALVARLSAEARLGADTRLQDVVRWLRAPEAAERPVGNLSAGTLAQVARQLNEAGGLANWTQSSRISQRILDERTPPAELLQAAAVDLRKGNVPAALARLSRLAESLSEAPSQTRQLVRAVMADVERGDAPAATAKITALAAEMAPRDRAEITPPPRPPTGEVAAPAVPAPAKQAAGDPPAMVRLLRAVVAEVERGNTPAALARLAGFIEVEPARARVLASDPAPLLPLVRTALAEVERGDVPAALARLAGLATPDPAQSRQLLQAAVDAVEQGDTPAALAKLATLAALDPARAERLPADPALAPIRPQVEALLSRLTETAQQDAGRLLAQVAEQLGAAPQSAENLRPATLLALAARLLDAGGHANWLHSAEISTLLLGGKPPAPADPAQAKEVLRAVIADARAGRKPEVMERVTTLAALDPPGARAAAADPALAPLRAEVEALLSQLAGSARLTAETRLEAATQQWSTPEAAGRPLPELQPETLLLCANRLMELGGYCNYIQLTAFAQAILALEGQTPGRRRQPRPAPESLGSRFRRLWRRAPLLILLLAWLGMGIMVGGASALTPERWTVELRDLFFEIWALGFLALIGFQFYMRVRRR